MQDASSQQQTKQNYKPNHQQTGLPPHSTLPIRGRTNKNSAQISPYIKLTQTTGPTLGGQKPKGRQNSALKPGKRRSQTLQVKKIIIIIMKMQRNTTQMKEQTRNTEVQINEEEIDKLPEKEFRIIIVKMIKNLEDKMKKMQESINKDLEELKNKHTETNNIISKIKNSLNGVNSRISSSSLICSSASGVLLLIPSRVFLISVIVLSLYVYSLIFLCLC